MRSRCVLIFVFMTFAASAVVASVGDAERFGDCATVGPLAVGSAVLTPGGTGLFDTDGFPPRWRCGTGWTGGLGWTHILADIGIWLSYMAIPVVLGAYMLRRRDVPFPAVGWLFVAFIFLCGTVHLLDATMFWWPGYRLLGLVKVLTAVASAATAVALVPVLPQALALPRAARMNAQLTAEVEARKRAESDLRRTIQVWSDAHRELAFQKFALDQASLVMVADAEGRITAVNHTLCHTSGYTREQLLGKPHGILYGDEQPREFFEGMERCIWAGDVWQGEICNRARDGSAFWTDTTIVPFRTVDGGVKRFVAIHTDISERRRAEEQLERALAWKERALQRERMLLRELEHRVRNNLAGLLGLTSIYEQSGRSGPEVSDALRGKIRAMLHVHEMMSPDPGAPIPLRGLVQRLAGQFGGEGTGAVEVSGPPVRMQAKHAGAMAMILQELFANSRRHGALGEADGSVTMRWETEDLGEEGQGLTLRWEERSSRPVSPPEHEGVGLRLVRGLSGSELRGSAEFSFGSTGFACLIRARLAGEIMPDVAPAVKREAVHEPDVKEAIGGAEAGAGRAGAAAGARR